MLLELLRQNGVLGSSRKTPRSRRMLLFLRRMPFPDEAFPFDKLVQLFFGELPDELPATPVGELEQLRHKPLPILVELRFFQPFAFVGSRGLAQRPIREASPAERTPHRIRAH